MWRGAGIFRDREGLAAALREVEALKNERLRAATRQNLLECCTAENQCLLASLVCRAALLRPECRGAHTRRDPACELPPDRSPYGHTYLSLAREGIEEVRA